VSIVDRYRLALVPRLVVDLSLLSDGDAVSLIEFMSDFNFDFRQYVVGIELDLLKRKSIIPYNVFQDCEPTLTLARYHGLKISITGLTPDVQGAEQEAILSFVPDRLGNMLELPSSMLNQLTDDTVPLICTRPTQHTNSARDYAIIFDWSMVKGNPIVLSSSGNGSCADTLDDFLTIVKARDMNDHDVAKLSLDTFHHILETSRKTRSELVKYAVIRTNKIVEWAKTNIEGVQCEP